MQAVVIRSFGGPGVLETTELSTPDPGAGQVRIRVQAAAVNPVDIATRAGWLAEQGLMSPGPQIGIGWDLAGIIEAVGAGVDRFEVGDPVIGMRPSPSMVSPQLRPSNRSRSRRGSGYSSLARQGRSVVSRSSWPRSAACERSRSPPPTTRIWCGGWEPRSSSPEPTNWVPPCGASSRTASMALDASLLESAAEAQERLAAGGLRGRIVLKPGDLP